MRNTCIQCQTLFEITSADLAFYDKVSPVFAGKKEPIPPPTLCPLCRDRRRYVFRNERHLYRRPCDLCGKTFISIYAPEKPYTVYCPSCFFSDRWNASDHALDFDGSRPFFDQFAELKRVVPRLGIDVLKNENSDYSNISIENRDCYLVFATVRSERCFYTRKIIHSVDTMDCTYGENLVRCYGCTDCNESYQLFFSQQCNNCSFSAFLYDCIGARNCFLCTNLRNKQYCFKNKQLTKDEYEALVPDISSLRIFQECQREFAALKLASIHRAHQNIQAEECLGDYLRNCTKCIHCFDMHNSEDCRYCTEAVTGLKSSMDCSSVTMECERDFECSMCSGATVFTSFSVGCRDGNSDLYYCDSVYGSRNLFGCIGLQRQKYCILNKHYTKEEYERIASKIIEHMRQAGEWGEFFPAILSPFDYNESVVHEFYPLSKDGALALGFGWRDAPDDIPPAQRVIPAHALPDSIDDIPDDILNWAIECETTKRPFKIIKQELELYCALRLPLPRYHPDARHTRRMGLRNPWKLWARKCMKCQKEMQTTYSPERPEIVYCEECYLKEVY